MTTPSSGVPSGAVRGRPPLIRPVTMLSGALVVVALLLAPYVRPWVTQRSQLAEGSRQVQALQREVDALSAEKRRWRDPAYVRAQARERLHYVNPGETVLNLLGKGAPAPSRPDPRSVEAALPSGSGGGVWYSRVWDSITMAGR